MHKVKLTQKIKEEKENKVKVITRGFPNGGRNLFIFYAIIGMLDA